MWAGEYEFAANRTLRQPAAVGGQQGGGRIESQRLISLIRNDFFVLQ
jgi:hypothetical protein